MSKNTNEKAAKWRCVFWILFALSGPTLLVIGFIDGEKKAKIKKKVNEQVEMYEKTLPGYLKRKQILENYRDSLMRINGM